MKVVTKDQLNFFLNTKIQQNERRKKGARLWTKTGQNKPKSPSSYSFPIGKMMIFLITCHDDLRTLN